MSIIGSRLQVDLLFLIPVAWEWLVRQAWGDVEVTDLFMDLPQALYQVLPLVLVFLRAERGLVLRPHVLSDILPLELWQGWAGLRIGRKDKGL